MRLDKLIKGIKAEFVNQDNCFNIGSIEIKGITFDSRKVRKNFIFVAIKGNSEDGSRFIAEAIAKGARAIVAESNVKTEYLKKIIFLKVVNSRRALLILADNYFNHPCKRIKLIGVTGTNGKTTVTYLIQSILQATGRRCGVIGTLGARFDGKSVSLENTTPSPLEIYSLIDRMVSSGYRYCVLEVSSHALIQQRINPNDFYAAIFTNLTWDHLDYHKSMKRYFLAKRTLFTGLRKNNLSIINSDDSYSLRLKRFSSKRLSTYGLDKKSDFYASNIQQSRKGLSFDIHYNSQEFNLTTNLLGVFNVYNILAGVVFCINEKIPIKKIQLALKKINIAGRMESVNVGNNSFGVFIDFAHTPEALKNAILSLRQITKGNLIVVFGCGGNRDKIKRPKMGELSTKLADFVIITSDNPRFEKPEKIIVNIVKGSKKKNYKIICERKKAIKYALSIARKEDNILIAGKGHENYQIIKAVRKPFSDKEQIKKCLKSKKY
ncbi:MAG: UDP-N-acetylmuramoyl-L-alanyl-D-glutamate--2,6-diaminopimelate ligase [Candidatus Gygaella obscura]|nr:UDP-N-acetylmuramoyl-L-alanyl-D-glutamate--2,6-diaminopimelate ligase [Candidatus Gygaella obscura]